jgi:hypothetical protein
VLDYRVTCRACGIIEKAGMWRDAVGRAQRHETDRDAPPGDRCEPGNDSLWDTFRRTNP